MGLPLTLFSVYGLVALSGVVVNDAIVLIDFINREHRKTGDLNQALIEAGRRRFRPVFLTSVTTIFGTLPILTETSRHALALIPMATSLAFGLTTATVIVLLLAPTLYLVVNRLAALVAIPFDEADLDVITQTKKRSATQICYCEISSCV
jgi:HAE1 family hydrophobic/amphiphilic exporter-1